MHFFNKNKVEFYFGQVILDFFCNIWLVDSDLYLLNCEMNKTNTKTRNTKQQIYALYLFFFLN